MVLNTLGLLATREAKRATVQRKRKACAELRELMVEVNVPEPQDQPRSEWKRETFSDLANQARPIPWLDTYKCVLHGCQLLTGGGGLP